MTNYNFEDTDIFGDFKNLYGKNLYEILEINNNSSKKDIKKAYKKLILKYHPDKNINISHEKFIEIKQAYDILNDNNKKKLYDNYILNKNPNIFDNIFDNQKQKIKEILINLTDINQIDKIIFILMKKTKFNYTNIIDFFSNMTIKDLLNIDITIDFTLKDLWYGLYKEINYKRITKENFIEIIYPFDLIQIYTNEGETIKINNQISNGDINIKINITETNINGEQYFIYNNELYLLVNSNRIINNKFVINFIDGNNYKFNLNKLSQIENELGKFYIKKNFGLINNYDLSTCINTNLSNSFFTHGNLFFIILL